MLLNNNSRVIVRVVKVSSRNARFPFEEKVELFNEKKCCKMSYGKSN